MMLSGVLALSHRFTNSDNWRPGFFIVGALIFATGLLFALPVFALGRARSTVATLAIALGGVLFLLPIEALTGGAWFAYRIPIAAVVAWGAWVQLSLRRERARAVVAPPAEDQR